MDDKPYTMMNITQQSILASNQGWECPRCHKIHAPSVPGCNCTTIFREGPTAL